MFIRSLSKIRGFRFCHEPDMAQKLAEWNAIAQQRQKQQMEYIEANLSEEQKTKVRLLIDAMLSLDRFELQCVVAQLHENQQKAFGVSMLEMNPEWPILKASDMPTWPPQSIEHIEKFLSQAFLGDTKPDFKMLFGGGIMNAGPAQSTAQAKAEEKAEAKPEAAKVEKTNFDVELVAIDAAQKIKIIKEVRQILNLGLKEAKDTVEKLPATLGKGLPKEKAEELKEKLTAAGCTINLV